MLSVFFLQNEGYAQQRPACDSRLQPSSFRWPLDNWHMSCGYRSTCYQSGHTGVDGRTTRGPGATNIGEPVRAPCSGIVKKAGWNNAYGGTAIIECLTAQSECVSILLGHMYPHLYGSSYPHMIPTPFTATEALQVQDGDSVQMGEIIGYLAPAQVNCYGDRGPSYSSCASSSNWAPHVHMTIRKGGYISSNNEYACGHWYWGGYPSATCPNAIWDDYEDPLEFIPDNMAPPTSFTAERSANNLCLGDLTQYPSASNNHTAECTEYPRTGANASRPNPNGPGTISVGSAVRALKPGEDVVNGAFQPVRMVGHYSNVQDAGHGLCLVGVAWQGDGVNDREIALNHYDGPYYVKDANGNDTTTRLRWNGGTAYVWPALSSPVSYLSSFGYEQLHIRTCIDFLTTSSGNSCNLSKTDCRNLPSSDPRVLEEVAYVFDAAANLDNSGTPQVVSEVITIAHVDRAMASYSAYASVPSGPTCTTSTRCNAGAGPCAMDSQCANGLVCNQAICQVPTALTVYDQSVCASHPSCSNSGGCSCPARTSFNMGDTARGYIEVNKPDGHTYSQEMVVRVNGIEYDRFNMPTIGPSSGIWWSWWYYNNVFPGNWEMELWASGNGSTQLLETQAFTVNGDGTVQLLSNQHIKGYQYARPCKSGYVTVNSQLTCADRSTNLNIGDTASFDLTAFGLSQAGPMQVEASTYHNGLLQNTEIRFNTSISPRIAWQSVSSSQSFNTPGQYEVRTRLNYAGQWFSTGSVFYDVTVPACTSSDWDCDSLGGWSLCEQDTSNSSGGSQTRTCLPPTNGCSSQEAVGPAESQECVYVPLTTMDIELTDMNAQDVHTYSNTGLWSNEGLIAPGGTGSFTRNVYLKVTDRGSMPLSATRAVLRLYVADVPGDMTSMHWGEITNRDWSEPATSVTDHDLPSGSLTNSIPMPSAKGAYIDVNVTTAYNSGTLFGYGIIISPDQTGGHAVNFTSTEGPDPTWGGLRPRLVVTYPAPAGGGGIDAGVVDAGAFDAGSVDAGPSSMTVELTDSNSADMDVTLSNNGWSDFYYISPGGAGFTRYAVLKMTDQTGLPTQVVRAELDLYVLNVPGNMTSMRWGEVTSNVTWTEPSFGQAYSNANVPTGATPNTLPAPSGKDQYMAPIDVTSAYNSGALFAGGIFITPDQTAGQAVNFASSEAPDPTYGGLKPRLRLTYQQSNTNQSTQVDGGVMDAGFVDAGAPDSGLGPDIVETVDDWSMVGSTYGGYPQPMGMPGGYLRLSDNDPGSTVFKNMNSPQQILQPGQSYQLCVTYATGSSPVSFFLDGGYGNARVTFPSRVVSTPTEYCEGSFVYNMTGNTHLRIAGHGQRPATPYSSDHVLDVYEVRFIPVTP